MSYSTTAVTFMPFASRNSFLILLNSLPIRSPASILSEEPVVDPQSLLEEKEALVEKLAISEYELRLAHEDALKFKTELQKKTETTLKKMSGSNTDASANNGPDPQQGKRDKSSDLGPLKDNERRDLNWAVKEYLLLAGYRLTAMTFYEEVTDQNLEVWQNSPACIPDALQHYYYEYLSSTKEAAEVLLETLMGWGSSSFFLKEIKLS